MIKRIIIICFIFTSSLYSQFLSNGAGEHTNGRIKVWIDLYSGEEISYQQVLKDLSAVDVLYLGEVHTIKSHHLLHRSIITGLTGMDRKIILVMEQLEVTDQNSVDLFNKGKINFDGLVRKISWDEKWRNYQDYRDIMETIQKSGGLIAAANAPGDIVRKIGKSGIGSLKSGERSLLPQQIQLGPDQYKKLLDKIMMVHAFMPPERLQFMYEAQVSRDQTMADTASSYIGRTYNDKEKYIVIVLAGAGHVKYGFGIPHRVRTKNPQVKDRIIISSSSELVLSEEEKAMARDIVITHDDLRFIANPAADYLFFISDTKKD